MYAVFLNGEICIGVNITITMDSNVVSVMNNGYSIFDAEFADETDATTAFESVKTALAGGATYLNLDTLLAVPEPEA